VAARLEKPATNAGMKINITIKIIDDIPAIWLINDNNFWF
jgi:hypothetical protein